MSKSTFRATSAGRQRADELQELFDLAPIGFVVLDETGNIRDANLEAARLLGASPSLLAGARFASYVEAAHRDAFADMLGTAPAAGGSAAASRSCEATLAAEKTEPREVRLLVSAHNRGEPTVLIAIHDLTAHREAERALRSDLEAQRRLEIDRSTLADLGAATATLDWDAALRHVARALVGSLADFSVVFVLEDGGGLRRAASGSRDPDAVSIADAKPPEDLRPDHPVRLAVRDRKSLLVEPEPRRSSLVVPLLLGDRVLGALELTSATRRFDERDLRLAEEAGRRCALFIANARLLERETRAVHARDEMLAVVAHDLRNPLHAILLQTQIARRAVPPEDPLQKAFTSIDDAVTRMNRLIDDMFDVARIEAGALEVARSRVSAGELVAKVIAAHRERVVSRSLELRRRAGDDLPALLADEDRLLQVFDNLIGNATKFTKTGSVTVGAEARERGVLFWVADTGPGIAPESLPHIFDRFWLARRTTRTGAGLGLAIVKGLVEAHGGRAWVESAVGKGTTIFFTIPRADSK